MEKIHVAIFVLLLNLIVESRCELIWADEFNGTAGSAPSADNWRFELGDGTAAGISGWGNSELQWYTNSTENAAVDGHGNLVITANRINTTQRCYYGPCSFTSARMVSKFTPLYGRIEARVKIPSGQGVWPAFWMLGDDIDKVGWPESGTIDIVQIKGSQPNKNDGGVHGPRYSGGEKMSAVYELSPSAGFDADFHVFTLDWQPSCLAFKVDNDVYFTLTPNDIPPGSPWVFDKPYRMMLTLAIGGHFAGFPMVNESFPKQYLIDYIRVYGDTTFACPTPKMADASRSNANNNKCNGFFSVIVATVIMIYLFGRN